MWKSPTVLVLLVGLIILPAGSGPGFSGASVPASSPDRFAKARAMIVEAVEKCGVPSILTAAEASTAGEPRMAMGWGVVDLAGYRFVLATGSAPGTEARLALVPAKNVAVAILRNATSSDDLALWRIE